MRPLLLLLLTLISFHSFSQIKIPENYEELSESPANGRKMNKLSTDFDADGKNDIALIIKCEKDFSKYFLLIYLTSDTKTYRLEFINEDDMSVYPVQLEQKKNVITAGYFKDGTAAFGRFFKLRYNKSQKKIQLIGYDSGYRISAAGHCDKTFNLLTGDYNVKILTALPENHKGNKKISPVFIQDINISMISKLDKIGSEFESQ